MELYEYLQLLKRIKLKLSACYVQGVVFCVVTDVKIITIC